MISLPLNVVIFTLYALESIFVAIFEHNTKLTFLACIYLYLVFQLFLYILEQAYVVVGCGAQARHTGVLIHQALTYANDPDLMLKVGAQAACQMPFSKHIAQMVKLIELFVFIDGTFCDASVTYRSKVRYKYSEF